MTTIGIPSNHLNHANPKHGTNYVDYTQQNYTAALREAGALPIVFPMGTPEEAAEFVNAVDAVLLIGGQDIGPILDRCFMVKIQRLRWVKRIANVIYLNWRLLLKPVSNKSL